MGEILLTRSWWRWRWTTWRNRRRRKRRRKSSPAWWSTMREGAFRGLFQGRPLLTAVNWMVIDQVQESDWSVRCNWGQDQGVWGSHWLLQRHQVWIWILWNKFYFNMIRTDLASLEFNTEQMIPVQNWWSWIQSWWTTWGCNELIYNFISTGVSWLFGCYNYIWCKLS